MSQQKLSEAGKDFLRQVADILSNEGAAVVANLCSTAQEMAEAELRLRAAVGAWKFTEPVSGTLLAGNNNIPSSLNFHAMLEGWNDATIKSSRHASSGAVNS